MALRFSMVLDLLIFVLLLLIPWLLPAAVRPVTGLAGLVLWIWVVRPTWRGLAPFYMTAALAVGVVAQAVSLLV